MGFDGHFLRSQTHLLVTATADLTVAKRIEPLLVHLRAAEDWICCQKRGGGGQVSWLGARSWAWQLETISTIQCEFF